MFRGIQEAIRQGLENIGKNSIQHGLRHLGDSMQNAGQHLGDSMQNAGQHLGDSIFYAALLISLTTLLVTYKSELKNILKYVLREYHSHAQEQAVQV